MTPPHRKLPWPEREAWETEQRAIVRQTLIDVGPLIGWETALDDQLHRGGVELLHPRLAGASLLGHLDAWNARLVVFGRFPNALHLHRRYAHNSCADPSCSITLSLNKSAQQVAREIGHRLLPEYQTLWKELSTRKATHEGQQSRMQQLAERIAANGRGRVIDKSRHEADIYRQPAAFFGAKSAGSEPWGKAEISDYHGLHATMELRNVPPELAEYIASLFGEWAEDA